MCDFNPSNHIVNSSASGCGVTWLPYKACLQNEHGYNQEPIQTDRLWAPGLGLNTPYLVIDTACFCTCTCEVLFSVDTKLVYDVVTVMSPHTSISEMIPI